MIYSEAPPRIFNLFFVIDVFLCPYLYMQQIWTNRLKFLKNSTFIGKYCKIQMKYQNRVKKMPQSEEITKLLQSGDSESFEKLLPLIYGELRSLATSLFRTERADHTLQPTALVHEAYLKLIKDESISWQNRAHFFGSVANSMRQILVNHAKAHCRQKRGGGQTLIELDDSIGSNCLNIDVLALHESLEALAFLDERQAKIVELRFFGGLTLNETAAALEVSTATVSREWEMARTWLFRRLSGT